MKLKLSNIEISALRQLCLKDASVGELAEQLAAKESFVSRVIKGLVGKGFVLVERRGTRRVVRLSPASHAQGFRRLSDSRPGSSLDWLGGAAVDLLVIAAEGAQPKVLFNEADCSKPTAYKTLEKLGAAGVLLRARETIAVSDVLAREFASAFAENVQLIIQQEAKGLNTSIRVRKHVVLRTDAKEVPDFFAQTGISGLAKQGLEGNLTPFNDYYFNLDEEKRSLGVEECFVHALLLATIPQHSDMTVLSIFFAKNKEKLNMQRLEDLARTYRVENKMTEMRQGTEFYEKMRELA